MSAVRLPVMVLNPDEFDFEALEANAALDPGYEIDVTETGFLPPAERRGVDWHPFTRHRSKWSAIEPDSAELSGVIAGQPHVTAGGVQHYLESGSSVWRPDLGGHVREYDDDQSYDEDQHSYDGDTPVPSQDAPALVRQGGDLYAFDGHHRLSAAMLSGDQFAHARVMDIDQMISDRGGLQGKLFDTDPYEEFPIYRPPGQESQWRYWE